MKKTWEDLLLYGNRDLLARAYQARHGGELSLKKARQIVASLEQGKEYFFASEGVGAIAKPLLVYYGVLSLSRAVILFSEVAAGEESLSPQHGISCLQWPAQLGGSLANIRGLRLKTTAGTFSDLVRATGNVERRGTLPHGMMGQEVVTAEARPLPPNLEFTFGDLLARIPELASLYEYVFEEKPECFDCVISGAVHDAGVTNSRSLICSLYNASTQHTPTEFQNVVGMTPDDRFATLEVMTEGPNEVWRIVVKLEGQAGQPKTFPQLFRKSIVYVHPASPTQTCLVWPLQNEYYLPTLPRLFLLSYGLGMLGRYFPSAWMSGQSLEVGTSCFPLLTKAVDFLQAAYPYAVLQEFQQAVAD